MKKINEELEEVVEVAQPQTLKINYHKNPDWGSELLAYIEGVGEQLEEDFSCSLKEDVCDWYDGEITLPQCDFKKDKKKFKLVVCDKENPENKIERIITSNKELWLTCNGKSKKNAANVSKYENNRVEWKKLDGWTKASFFVMGLSQIKNKRYVEGIFMLLIELGFIVFMALAGVNCIIDMITLGTVAPGKDPVTGIVNDGDNSMLMLLYGVITVLIIAIFALFYYYTFRSTVELDRSVKEGKKYSFKKFMKSLANDKLYIVMLIIPLAGVLVFTIVPLIYMILIAFTNYDHEHVTNFFDWVGFKNFTYLFGQDARFTYTFWTLLVWTLVWAVFSTFTCFFGGMALAMLIKSKNVKGKVIFRTIFVLTIAVPSFISLMSIGTMLDKDGVINQLLLKYGFIDKPLPFLTDATWARATVIIVNLWLGAPTSMLITTGILLNIPSDLFESARMDGAGPFVIFRKIIMPYIMFVCTPYLINAFIANVNNFNAIYFLTMNANLPNPGYASGALPTDLLVTWLYKLTVDSSDYSYGSAIGIMVFIVSASLSLVLLRRSSSFKNEGSF